MEKLLFHKNKSRSGGLPCGCAPPDSEMNHVFDRVFMDKVKVTKPVPLSFQFSVNLSLKRVIKWGPVLIRCYPFLAMQDMWGFWCPNVLFKDCTDVSFTLYLLHKILFRLEEKFLRLWVNGLIGSVSSNKFISSKF